MPISLAYNADNKILRVSIIGQFMLEEYKQALETIVNHSNYPPNVLTIWDLVAMDFTTLSRQDVAKIVAQREMYPQRNGAIVAYVVDSQLGYGLMRMMEAFFGGESDNYSRVFYDYAEAEVWLLQH